jgi:large subunit ribosomal protein L35
MPKMKTHSGAKKRFRKTGTGRIRARHAFTSHNLGKKPAKRKRRLGRPVEGAEGARAEVRRLLAGGGRKK